MDADYDFGINVFHNLYFRQSMINDYLKCPQFFLYRWVAGLEEEKFWPAAVFGTAGHEVIREMHESDKFNYRLSELTERFIFYAEEEAENSRSAVTVGKQFDSFFEQLQYNAPFYVELLAGYQSNDNNRTFNCAFNEQAFVLEMPVDNDNGNNEVILFTGTIDQAGWYRNGQFALRDIKFRDNAFRPGFNQHMLDLQLNLYSYALKHGMPVCDNCKPKIDGDGTITGIAGKLIYNGPCLSCKEKIETPAWPAEYPELSEILWMRDYERRKKDQYAKEIISETEKERNPKTGRMRKKRTTNPKWIEGYKKGDFSGPGKISSERSENYLTLSVRDIMRIALSMRDGVIYRRPSEYCNYDCHFKKHCLEHLKDQADAFDLHVPNQGSIRDNKESNSLSTSEQDFLDMIDELE